MSEQKNSSEGVIGQFVALFETALTEQVFQKMTFSKPQKKGLTEGLKNVYVRWIQVKGQPQLQFNYRYASNDVFQNVAPAQSGVVVAQLLTTTFYNADMFTETHLWSLLHAKKIIEKKQVPDPAPTPPNADLPAHDKVKKRYIAPSAPYLHDLAIANDKGEITPTGQKKYKQINKYIEILDDLLQEIPFADSPLHIVDMGCGKGYLTFALHDFLTNGRAPVVQPLTTGIELRENLVTDSNQLAQRLKIKNLHFINSDIRDFEGKIDLLIALHACDIATDIALEKGIRAGASLIVVAPCCHKQIRREMQFAQSNPSLQPMLRYGILEERMAEMLTDTIRALLLEAHGYKTKVFEFIALEHTAKNVMITATKIAHPAPDQRQKALAQIAELKTLFGIQVHYLEQLLAQKEAEI